MYKSRLDQNYGCTLRFNVNKKAISFPTLQGVKSRIFLSFQRYPQSFTLLQKKEVKSATQLEYDVFKDTPTFCWACFYLEYLKYLVIKTRWNYYWLLSIRVEQHSGGSIPNYM